MNPETLLSIIKLVLGGITCFFAIMIMSKTRKLSWMFIVIGFLLSYAALVFEQMVNLGVLTNGNIFIFGIPLTTLICTFVPSIFFLLAFIFKLNKK